jgi:hypothetical protein
LPLTVAAWALLSPAAPAQYAYPPNYYNPYNYNNQYNYYNNYPRPAMSYPATGMPYGQAAGPYWQLRPAQAAPPMVYQYGPLDGAPINLPAPSSPQAQEAAPAPKPAARSVVVTPAKGEAPPVAAPAPAPPPPMMVEMEDQPPVGYASIDAAPAVPADHDDGPRFGDHRSGVFGEFLYLRPRGADVVFAQPQSGCGTAAVPNGPSAVLAPDYSPGFRAGGFAALNNCSSIEAAFSWWDDDTHSTVVAPGGTVLHSLLVLPSTTSCSATSAQATGGLSLGIRTGDVSYKRLLCSDGHAYYVNWLAGAYYAHLDQALATDFSISGHTTVDTHINQDGVGPRVGLEGEALAKWGISVYGRGTANLLASHIGASFIQHNTFAGNQGFATFADDRILPILDLELGIGWTSPKGHVRVLGGYYVAGWFNTLVTSDFINAVQANNFSNHGDNLSNTLWFDGLVGRVEVRF